MMSRIDRLTGARVVVRPFERGDLTADYVGWLNDPEVVRFSNQRFRRHTLESCEVYFESFTESPNQFLSVRLLNEDRAVGTMTVYRSPHHNTADVGIMIGDSAQRGTGIGREAWSLVIDWLVGTGGVRKVTAGTLRCNLAMVRLMQHAGLHEEAIRAGQELVEGHAEDIIHYARFGTG